MDIQVLRMLSVCLSIVSTEFGTVERPWFLEVGGAVILRYSVFRTLPNSWPWMQNSEEITRPICCSFNAPYYIHLRAVSYSGH